MNFVEATILARKQIMDRLVERLPNVDVMRGDITEDGFRASFGTSSKLMRPYVLVASAGYYDAFDRGLCGPEHDPVSVSLNILVVASSFEAQEDVGSHVVGALLGFQSEVVTDLRVSGGFVMSDADFSSNRRYGTMFLLRYKTNIS